MRLWLIGSFSLPACILLDTHKAEPALELSTLQRTALQQLKHRFNPLRQWNLSARISIRKGDEVMLGKILWQQYPDNYLIQFNAPFGGGAVQIRGAADGVELHMADGQSIDAEDAQTLFEEQTGWPIPINSMHAWVVGIPVEASITRLKFDSKGRLSYLRQRGWDVNYQRYQSVGDYELPKKLTITNDDMSIRMVIDRWGVLHQGDIDGILDART